MESGRGREMRTVQPTKPGWYNDPDGRYSHQAYWNGEKWTGATRPTPSRTQSVAAMSLWAVTVAVVAVLFNLGCDLLGLFALLAIGAVSGIGSVVLSHQFVRSTHQPPLSPQQPPTGSRPTKRWLLWVSWLLLILYAAVAVLSFMGFRMFCA